MKVIKNILVFTVILFSIPFVLFMHFSGLSYIEYGITSLHCKNDNFEPSSAENYSSVVAVQKEPTRYDLFDGGNYESPPPGNEYNVELSINEISNEQYEPKMVTMGVTNVYCAYSAVVDYSISIENKEIIQEKTIINNSLENVNLFTGIPEQEIGFQYLLDGIELVECDQDIKFIAYRFGDQRNYIYDTTWKPLKIDNIRIDFANMQGYESLSADCSQENKVILTKTDTRPYEDHITTYEIERKEEVWKYTNIVENFEF